MKNLHLSTLALDCRFRGCVSHRRPLFLCRSLGMPPAPRKMRLPRRRGRRKISLSRPTRRLSSFSISRSFLRTTRRITSPARGCGVCVSRIAKPGDITFHAVTSEWSDVDGGPEPSFDPIPLATLPESGIRDKGIHPHRCHGARAFLDRQSGDKFRNRHRGSRRRPKHATQARLRAKVRRWDFPRNSRWRSARARRT